MGSMTSKLPSFATEMARLQLEMQANPEGQPDLERIRRLATQLSEADAEYQKTLDGMMNSEDFQAREYYKLTQAWSEKQGLPLEKLRMMMRWQTQCMFAMADGRPPPFPPPGLDVAKIAEQQQQSGGSSMLNQVGAAQAVDATPFTGEEAAFESPVVREEYESLCRDHDGIIRLGQSFGTFDPLGKLAYLDSLEAIEERWDIFFSRFALLGVRPPRCLLASHHRAMH